MRASDVCDLHCAAGRATFCCKRSVLESSVFQTMLPQFQNLTTTKDNSVALSNDGKELDPEKSNLNPFEVGGVPEEFVTAVGKDDNDVIAYIRGLNNPDISISKSGNLDTIIIGMGKKGSVKTKTFTVDPNIEDDAVRAAEIWDWMRSNYSAPLTAADYAAGKVQ